MSIYTNWMFEPDGMLSVPAIQTMEYEANTDRIIEQFEQAIENGLNPNDPSVQSSIFEDMDIEEFDKERVQLKVSELWEMAQYNGRLF